MKGFFAVLLFVSFSCRSKTSVPEGILPIPQMTNLLWDVILADGLASYRYPADTLKRFDTSVVLYQQIARAHQTTQQQFKKSLQFYESRPDLLQIIVDSLQKRSTLPVQAYKKDTLKKPGLIKKPI